MNSKKAKARGPYVKPKKMGLRERRQLLKSRDKARGVRELKANLVNQIKIEQEALNELVRIRNLRAAYMRGTIGKVDPILVYADFDEMVGSLHDQNPKNYPRWDNLTDAAKAHIGFLLCLCFDGYSFTANVSKKLEESWKRKGLRPRDRAIFKINQELKKVGLSSAPYFFVIEAKGRYGKSRTRLHIHGYCLLESGHEATRFKTALEKALYRELRVPKGEGPPVKIERSYELGDAPEQSTYWVGYSLKNAILPGPKIEGTPLYLNMHLRQCTREFWNLIREVD
jgi:hypothetical protein